MGRITAMTDPRTPLDQAELQSRIPAGWHLRVVAETGSTNADLIAAAADGAPARTVLVAELQTQGRGRLDRSWLSPAGAGLTVSVLLRPTPPTQTWGWLPLLAGVAVAAPLARLSGLAVGLKWPNDVLVEERKLGGLLAETSGDAVVVGVGLNVSLREDERPVPTATSLRMAGSDVVDREPVLRAVLRDLAVRYRSWVAAQGDPAACGLLREYRETCVTLGQTVTAHLPGGRTLTGEAFDVDEAGCLLVRDDTGVHPLGAGDVVHVR